MFRVAGQVRDPGTEVAGVVEKQDLGRKVEFAEQIDRDQGAGGAAGPAAAETDSSPTAGMDLEIA